MNEENQTPKESTETSEGSPPAQISKPFSTLPASQPATEKQLDKVEREMNAFERSTLKWTRATFVILLVTCLFIGFQWHEMSSGSADTHTLAEQAKKQADKMSDMSNAAEKIRQAAENMVTQDQRIADNAQKALDASNRQSKATLDATIQNFQRDERAWIGTGEFSILQFNNSDPFQLAIPFINSGKSPAINTEIATNYSFSDSFLVGPPVGSTYTFEKTNAIPPQGRYTLLIRNSAVPPQYDALVNGKRFLQFSGQYKYEDVYRPGLIHTTRFCLYYDWQRKGMSYCFTGNDID